MGIQKLFESGQISEAARQAAAYREYSAIELPKKGVFLNEKAEPVGEYVSILKSLEKVLDGQGYDQKLT
jgi:hypothetical protein